jgi:3-oxoacyl-[acyl-carrier protein] reductase
VISTNLRGPYFLTQSVAAWMIRQRAKDPSAKRSIINISSVSATVASVNRGDYCISKAGIAMATKLWAVRLAEYGIGVYEVRPGIIETEMTEGVKGKYNALIEGGILLEKRWGTPKDIGTAVSMLARGELPYATGAVLVLDGGLTTARL